MHTKFFGNLEVIITSDFYQVQPIPDVRVFKINMNNIDNLTPNFWMEKIKCYELKQVTCQSDEQFINILNRFRIATQSQFDNQCFHTPPKFPYYFIQMKQGLNTMNQPSYKVMEMHTYFV